LKEAREEAFALVEEDPEMRSPENTAVREQLLHRWRGRLSLAEGRLRPSDLDHQSKVSLKSS